METTDTGVVQAAYTYGNDLISMNRAGVNSYYRYDGLGSVVALSNSSGNVEERYSYDVFGEPTIRDSQGNIIPQSQFGNRFMFTGREYDSETGLYYCRARYYSPKIGRFLQPDPLLGVIITQEPISKLAKEVVFSAISSAQQFNPLLVHGNGIDLYAYVLNNPLNSTDPSGLFCCNWAAVGFCLGERYLWLLNNPGAVGACGIMCSACIASNFTAFWPCLGCGGCVAGAIVSVAACFDSCEW